MYGPLVFLRGSYRGGNMYYSDDDLIMISALQHYSFCPRQCALIHLEQQWEENYLTASGASAMSCAVPFFSDIAQKRG